MSNAERSSESCDDSNCDNNKNSKENCLNVFNILHVSVFSHKVFSQYASSIKKYINTVKKWFYAKVV